MKLRSAWPLLGSCFSIVSALVLSLALTLPAYADADGTACFNKCTQTVTVSVRGQGDYIASMGGQIEILSPPLITNPRIDVRFADYNNQVKVERWYTGPSTMMGHVEGNWPVGARFGPGTVCATAYSGPNQLATACVAVKA